MWDYSNFFSRNKDVTDAGLSFKERTDFVVIKLFLFLYFGRFDIGVKISISSVQNST